MFRRLLGTFLGLTGVSTPRLLAAQTTVTFELPVNLTQVSPDIEKVIFQCVIRSAVIVAPDAGQTVSEDVLPVVGGRLVTIMRVVFIFPDGSLQNPIGKNADYSCYLIAHNKKTGGNTGFSETSTDPAYFLKPTPPSLTGSFVW